MPVTLAAPCVKRYDLLAKLFASAEKGSLKPDRYVVIDTGCRIKQSGVQLPANTEVHDFGSNIGVSAAWNRVFQMYDDYIIISNDDVEVDTNTIESLVHAAKTSDALFIHPTFNAGAMFCVFLMKQACIAKIGGFDERFWPGYFEDNDYHRRMRLAGIKELQAENASYKHVGSATLKSFNQQEIDQHHEYFRRNQQYYVKKWGGLPGHETRTKPAEVP